jgi:hypothetical protein
LWNRLKSRKLEKFVGAYSLFPTYQANKEFLAVLNWKTDEHKGLAEAMQRYSKVSFAERRGEAPATTTKTHHETQALAWKT